MYKSGSYRCLENRRFTESDQWLARLACNGSSNPSIQYAFSFLVISASGVFKRM